MTTNVDCGLSVEQKNIILRYHSNPLDPGILDGAECCPNLVEELNKSCGEVLKKDYIAHCIKKWKDLVQKEYFYVKKIRSNFFTHEDLKLLMIMNKDSLNDVQEVIKIEKEVTCRICLAVVDYEDTCNLFTTFVNDNLSLADLVSYFTLVLPTKQDGLPDVICIHCTKTLKMMHNFRQMCERNDLKLLRDAAGGKSEDITEMRVSDDEGDPLSNTDEWSNQDNEDLAVKVSLECFPEIIIKTEMRTTNPKEDSVRKIQSSTGSKELKKSPKEIKIEVSGVKCDKCGKMYTNKYSLNVHNRNVHKKIPKIKVKCDDCGKIYASSASLYMHRRHMHPNSPRVPSYHMGKKIKQKCEKCGKWLSSKYALYVHNKYVHEPRNTAWSASNQYGCAYCGKYFPSKGVIKQHVRTHSQERPFTCETCGKSYKAQDSLKVHMANHLPEKPFCCEICPYRASNKYNLKIHLRSHSQTKQYPCDFCSSSFKTSSNKSKHIDVIHKNIRPFKCSMCDKSFSSKHLMECHAVTHTGARPYQCPVCMESYAWYHGMTRHMTKFHPGAKKPKEIPTRKSVQK